VASKPLKTFRRELNKIEVIKKMKKTMSQKSFKDIKMCKKAKYTPLQSMKSEKSTLTRKNMYQVNLRRRLKKPVNPNTVRI